MIFSVKTVNPSTGIRVRSLCTSIYALRAFRTIGIETLLVASPKKRFSKISNET